MKQSVKELPANPFDQNKDPKEVMRELLKHSRPITHQEAVRRMKDSVEAQKKNK